jgi:endo-1,4-beta-xylanase
VAVNTDLLRDDAAYRRIVNQQFSTVTPENAMKWESVEATRGTYTWQAADRLVNSARRNGQLVRGHTLVWHSQLPTWLATTAPDGSQSTTLSKAELRAVLKKHIRDEVRHFRGRIWQWDVVNEAFNDDGTLRNSIWLQKLGPGYLADAFRWAHEADPHAQLFYNDYNIEFTGPKSNAVYRLVKDLKARGVPIHGVGFQTHLDTQYGFPDLRANLQRFADVGLNVAETEVDVRTFVKEGTNTPVSGLAQSAQEAYWSQTLQACLAVRRCISYTVWGVADSNSWIPGVFKGEGAALLYDDALKPKRQYTVLQQDLELAAGAPHRRAS